MCARAGRVAVLGAGIDRAARGVACSVLLSVRCGGYSAGAARTAVVRRRQVSRIAIFEPSRAEFVGSYVPCGAGEHGSFASSLRVHGLARPSELGALCGPVSGKCELKTLDAVAASGVACAGPMLSAGGRALLD